MLPKDLEHWRQMATALNVGPLWLKQDFRDFATSLPEAAIERLGQFHDRAVAAGDILRLDAWFKTAGPATPRDSDERLVHNLLVLFEHLGVGGYATFRSYPFRRVTAATKLDWSKLPQEMSFLAEPAEKYRDVVFDRAQEDFVDRATPQQRREFEELDLRCNAVGFDTLGRWSHSMGVGEHREAALVASLLGLITRMFPEKYGLI